MQIGCLGNIIFQVNDKIVETPSSISRTGSARIAEHKLHNGNTLAEFMGIDAERMSFNIILSADMGVNIEDECKKIQTATEKGTQLPLVIGTRTIGRHRWLINSYRIIEEAHNAAGNASLVVITINLLEYSKTQ